MVICDNVVIFIVNLYCSLYCYQEESSILECCQDTLREEEVEKLSSKAAKADHIASRTIRAINVKMNEDPVFYKKLSKLIKNNIEFSVLSFFKL